MFASRHHDHEPLTATHAVQIACGTAIIHADLTIPAGARGIVIFAHGSGSSRTSRRNQSVAAELNWGRLATLLVDLLTPNEAAHDAHTAELRFDIQLLAGRVVHAIDWVSREPGIRMLPVGLFGASTGAAAALFAATRRPDRVKAIVSRGGRVDLAESVLSLVNAPTLFIVGENDPDVLTLNRQALPLLRGDRRLEIIPGASHLFEESGALEAVATCARTWLVEHLEKVVSGGAGTTGW
jgi:pimeloyl-ACP methyl ester carboxylesterase